MLPPGCRGHAARFLPSDRQGFGSHAARRALMSDRYAAAATECHDSGTVPEPPPLATSQSAVS